MKSIDLASSNVVFGIGGYTENTTKRESRNLAVKSSGGIKSTEHAGLETIYEDGKCMKQFDLSAQRMAFHSNVHVI